MEAPVYNLSEDFDPSLARLNSMEKLSAYCDSLYEDNIYSGISKTFETAYPEIALSTIRKKFYHGYSRYDMKSNPISTIASKFTYEGYNAIVIPDDIIKYPYAACSQQSIVTMELLKKKGFMTRKVSLKGKRKGHFCFEVYYNGMWHFYDPDMEPDLVFLDSYNRPGIAFLANHPDILTKAYRNYPKELILDIFQNYFYGPVNSFPAPKAILFQKITYFLSYTLWIFFLLAFAWMRIKYKKLKKSAAPKIEIHNFIKHSMSMQLKSLYSAQ